VGFPVLTSLNTYNTLNCLH